MMQTIPGARPNMDKMEIATGKNPSKTVNTGGVKPGYLGPPESFRHDVRDESSTN